MEIFLSLHNKMLRIEYIILLAVLGLLLGSYLAGTVQPSEGFTSSSNEMQLRSGASRKYGDQVETYETSTSTQVDAGGSQKYGYGYNPIIPPPPPVRPPQPIEPVQPIIIAPGCPAPAPAINAAEICRNCDITMNKDIDKYVLKSSVPPCPNMHNYVKKSDLPACPPQQPCPKCPLCPACPQTFPTISPAELLRLQEVAADIRRHPQYHEMMAKCVAAPQPAAPVVPPPIIRGIITTRDPPPTVSRVQQPPPPPPAPIQQAIRAIEQRQDERRETQEQNRRIKAALTNIAQPLPGQVMSENDAANTVKAGPSAYPTWVSFQKNN